QHGYLRDAVLPHLVRDLLVAQVGLRIYTGVTELRDDIECIRICIGRDRQHLGLSRGEPQWQMPRMVLEQDADEAFERSKDRPMQHHRRMLLSVLSHVRCSQPTWHVQVDLQRSALPIPAY